MSRRGRVPCPGCGAQLVWVLYVPAPDKLRQGQPRKHVPLDAAPVADDDEYAQHAASPGMTICRRITEDEPLIAGFETRHTIHHATHPECSDLLRGTPGRTAR